MLWQDWLFSSWRKAHPKAPPDLAARERQSSRLGLCFPVSSAARGAGPPHIHCPATDRPTDPSSPFRFSDQQYLFLERLQDLCHPFLIPINPWLLHALTNKGLCHLKLLQLVIPHPVVDTIESGLSQPTSCATTWVLDRVKLSRALGGSSQGNVKVKYMDIK